MTVLQLLQKALAPTAAEDTRRALETWAQSLEAPCLGVTHDSRDVRPGFVFVALRGLKAEGVAFAPQAIAAGARAVVAERDSPAGTAVPWVVVRDARLALASLSAEFYGHPSRQMRVVGITGTNGKTTTSYLVSSMFEAAGIQCGVMGTVSHRIGDREVPATRTTPEAPELQRLLREMADAGCGACAMEVSSHALALRRADAIEFAAGVFTNLTRDHLDFHTDMEQYFAAKRRLFELLPPGAPAVVNVDDPRGAAIVEMASRPVTYSLQRRADVTPGPIALTLRGLEFDIRIPQGTVHVHSNLIGRPNVYNILAATGVAAGLDLPLDAMERGIARLAGVPGRFERVSTPADDVTVIVDYAHTDDALRNLLETARPLAARRLITVFGAGGDRDRTKRPLMGMVAARLSDVVVITSDNPRSEEPQRIMDEIALGVQAEARQRDVAVVGIVDRREAIHHAVSQAAAGDVVLIAGKGHEKYQEIAGRALPFDDSAEAREALAARRRGLHVG
jgi:UDP-N-acetylmuramoyl-L-alanyl-D-glutamate--2,6-diaminopimelate ligase